jgi:hypothetical protein
MELTVNGRQFSAVLENNPTANAFRELLPLTLHMTELNGNEKYADMPKQLPTKSFKPGTIEEGDILLYGSSTVVVFYKKFNTPYSYTRIGKLTEVEGLAAALGKNDVKVNFSK